MQDLNFFATLALVGVILSAFAVVVARRPEDTCYTLILAAIMFLPVGIWFKLPKFPQLDRDTLPYLVLFLAYLLRRTRWVTRNKPFRALDVLVPISMVAALFTVRANPEPITVSGYEVNKILPGLNLNDGLFMAGEDMVRMGLPFLVGRLLMRSPREATRLLTAFAVGGLIYSILILFEVRMSPQVHALVYGAAPRRDDFAQAIRFGGYRPVVFMPHGLAVALFVCNTVMAAFILARSRAKFLGLSWKPLAFYLFFILVATKSMAAIIYAVVALPLLALTRARTQLRVAVLVAVVVLLYPAMRAADLFPAKGLVSVFASFSPERAESLDFRINNEDQLLEHARHKAYFGWGAYGRNIVYDKESGKEATVFDGYWIIILLVPVFMAIRRLRKIPDKREQLLLAGLAMMVAVTVLDLLPNGLLLTYPYFLSGSLFGLVRILTTHRPAEAAPPVDQEELQPA
jgi:hypothetical protein